MGVLPLEFWLRLAACELNRILALKSGVRWWRWPGRRQRLVPAVERELELSYPALDDLELPLTLGALLNSVPAPLLNRLQKGDRVNHFAAVSRARARRSGDGAATGLRLIDGAIARTR